jgi:hypothetical protein
MRSRLIFSVLTAFSLTAFAVGGDVRENVTQKGFSVESPDKACAAAAKRLKQEAAMAGWKILSKGNVPCECKVADGGWRCTITALVEKPDPDDDGYRN